MQVPELVPYDKARAKIQDADLLLFRPRSLVWRLIAVAGRSEYTHAALAGKWHGRLMCVEMTAGGGRASLLSNLVEQYPGVIDVFEVNACRSVAFSRRQVLAAMLSVTGRRYGWLNLFRAALLHLPLCRFLVRPDCDDLGYSSLPPFCSQAVAYACRFGGVDPVPHLADRLTEPGDLARSPFFRYRFTLTTPNNL